MRYCFFLAALFFTQLVSAQQVNGIWKGKLVMEPGGCFPVYHMELQITVNGTKVTGSSYHYSDTTNFVKEEFEGSYDTVSKILHIQETKVATFRIPADCTPCIKRYVLEYHTDGKEEQLRGSWTGKTLERSLDCPPGSIVLTRSQKSDFTPPPPPKLTNRNNELVRELYVDTGKIRIDFYDNGQIDGDTITVFVNNIPVISREMLSLKPVTTYVTIDALHPEHEIVMFGENMGTIPPNTALMIIKTKDERYQLYLTSDEKKKAMVRLIYRKPDKK